MPPLRFESPHQAVHHRHLHIHENGIKIPRPHLGKGVYKLLTVGIDHAACAVHIQHGIGIGKSRFLHGLQVLCRIRDMPHQIIAFIKGVRSFTAEIRLTAQDSPPG